MSAPNLTAAPAYRAVDALSGRVAESDAEVERLREENAELRCRIQELEENAQLRKER